VGRKNLYYDYRYIYISTGLVPEGEQAEKPEARREGGHAEGEKKKHGERGRLGEADSQEETGGLVEGAKLDGTGELQAP